MSAEFRERRARDYAAEACHGMLTLKQAVCVIVHRHAQSAVVLMLIQPISSRDFCPLDLDEAYYEAKVPARPKDVPGVGADHQPGLQP